MILFAYLLLFPVGRLPLNQGSVLEDGGTEGRNWLGIRARASGPVCLLLIQSSGFSSSSQ